MKKTPLFIISVFLLLSCSDIISVNDTREPPFEEPPDLPVIQQKYYSTSVEDTFYLYSAFPGDYDQNRVEPYDVIYVLDGDVLYTGPEPYIFRQKLAVVLIDSLINGGYIPPCIIIGIGYGPNKWWKRYRDYYSPQDTMYTEYGRAEAFYSFLKNELIPLVDNQFNTSRETGRSIIGHSGGGYFVMHAAFSYEKNEPVLFNKFLSSSPIIDHYDYYLLQLAEACERRNSEKFPFRFFYSFGNTEHPREEMTVFNETLGEYLADFRYIEFIDRNHSSAASVAFYYGLMWLYGTDFYYD